MKIAVDTSSFSLPFLGWAIIILAILFALIFKFSDNLILLFSLIILGLLLISQRYKYLITHSNGKTTARNVQTLNFLSLKFEQVGKKISVKDIIINSYSLGPLTLLSFKFNKINSTRGSYVANTLVKYQRYV